MSYFDDMEIDMYQEEEKAISNFERGAYSHTKAQTKKPMFTRGYKESRERLAKNPYYCRSCFNCDYYYQAVGDKEECCQNSNVLEYDMVVDKNNVYCVHWVQSKRSDNKSLFKKKLGRSVLD